MTTSASKTVWSTPDRNRHFVIPDDTDLPTGPFALRTVVGRQMDVDEQAALHYEVSRDEAKEYLKQQMGDVVEQAKDAVMGWLRKGTETPSAAASQSSATKATGDADPATPEPPPHRLRDIVDRATADLPDEDKATLEETARQLGDTIKDLGKIVQGSLSDDSEMLDEARQRIQSLRSRLEDQGIPLGESVDNIPDKINEFASSARTAAKDPVARADHLDDMADRLEEVGRHFAQRLRDKARELRNEHNNPPTA